MAFALQEAKTVLAMLLNRFDFRYDGPDVKIHPKMATTKPMDLMMTIHPRENFPQPNTAILNTHKSKPNKTTTTKTSIPVSVHVTTTAAELPPITFLYGTQTGTAQDYANQLAKQAKNFGFTKTTLCDMDKWSVLHEGKQTDEELVVICTATYNGQPPDSAEKFNRFLDYKMNEQNHQNLLKGLSFAVFGLGNKNWRTYQNFPRKVADCLEEFGATRFFSSGEGDADQDMDAEFNEWCAHFWTYTLDHYHIAAASESKSVVPVAASTALDPSSSVKIKFISRADKDLWNLGTSNCNGKFNATVHVNYELQTSGSPRSTRHIEVDISQLAAAHGTALYQVGDHFEVMPENSPQDVESIALGFGLVLDAVFEIDQDTISDVSPRSLAANIKGPCSVRNMLTFYADITSPPSRAMLGYFSSQLKTIDPDTALTFKNLVMPDEKKNKDMYPEFIRKHRTLLDLQKAYPQVTRLDLAQFLATVSVIQPRRYSIASSPLVDPTCAHLSVSVVDDVVQGTHYPGLSSSFLKRSMEGTKLRASLKSSKDTFSLVQDSSTPIIMISAGTGFAPFRGFLQERKAQLDLGQKIGNAVLFFGCRRKDQDFIYQEEIEEHEESGVLTQVYTAFSRSNEPKKYVQHQLLAQAAPIWNMLFPTDPDVKPALVYVCGSGAMSNDVRLAFCNMAVSFGAASNDKEASDLIDKLIDDRRYFCDVWG